LRAPQLRQDTDPYGYPGGVVLRSARVTLPVLLQGKLVRVVQGEVFDVAVDIRKFSHSFGQWVGINLSAENKLQLWIPEGFVVLTEQADFLYKTTDYYAPNFEHCIRWNDPDIGIDWPRSVEPLLSNKDAQGVPNLKHRRYLTDEALSPIFTNTMVGSFFQSQQFKAT
jgi:dTDP-4-dehydrorhamnose 3,5-epimerase